MRFTWIAGAILLCANVEVTGQASEFESLSIDRPDVSNLPTTIRPGHYQFEFGTERGRGTTFKEFHVPNMIFRTGINQESELRIGFDYISLDSLGTRPDDGVMFGMVGGKYRFVEQKGVRPAIALQAEFAIPFGAGNYALDRADYNLAAYSFLLLFNNTLHQQVFINYNAGVFWSRVDLIDFLASASLSFLHTHRVGYYLEVYTLILNKGVPLSFDGGLMFLVSPRFQIDVYGGQRAFELDRFWFWGAGFGFRLDKGDLKPKTFKEIGIHH